MFVTHGARLACCDVARHNGAMRVWIALLSTVSIAGCTAQPAMRRPPTIAVGALAPGLEPFLAAHPPAPGQNIRADEIGRTASASYHVVQVADRETPHTHATHDLTVLVLRGKGRLTLDGGVVSLVAGDVVVVPRGRVHWFARDGDEPAVAFVTFTPPLDAPDTVPVDSDGGRR
jgi:quercetin dioxygenase-like cupin family protein